jgi:condensin-2 complex subunit H2
MSAGSQETRYGHLLTPIRDLAANWSVDIAGELEEYLLELEDLEISEPAHSQTNLQHLDYKGKGKGTLNFVEAALLIQGSVCVYSKKVEFLYKLLYQTLAAVSTKRKLKKGGKHASSVNEQGVDMDAIFAAEESEFLPLDDLLVEGKHSR